MLLVKVHGIDIPLINIGTSPFIGAGQFGFKGLRWRRRFLHDPEAMAELLKIGYKCGAVGVHVIPEGSIERAVRMVQREYPDFKVIGSLPPANVTEGLDVLVSLGAQIIFLHGEVGDARDEAVIRSLMNQIKDRGCKPGVATHTTPVKTVKFLVERRIDAPILLPFNKMGYSMEDKESLERLVDSQPIECVGMKVLAAGRLKPKEAFQYISHHRLKAVIIGAVQKDEIREATHYALQYLTHSRQEIQRKKR